MSRRFLAAALTVVVVAGLAVAGPAVALVSVVTTLYSGSLTVHTANGKTWHLGLSVNPNGDGSTSELGETILRSFAKGEEDHEWYDTIAQSSLTFNTNSGDGTLKTPQSVAALTTLNLKFATTSRRNAACSSGSKTYYFGNLTGTAIVHTQLHAGGTVGGRHVSFAKGKTEVIADSNCTPPSTSRCYKSMSFQANGNNLHTMWGAGPPSRSFVYLVHGVTVNRPAGASRQDGFSIDSSRAPAFNAKAHTLQVWAASSGAFTGTGRFTGGTLSKSVGACTVKGASHTEHIRVYENAVFRNGANHPLVAHTSLVGKMTVPRTNHTSYEFDTWS